MRIIDIKNENKKNNDIERKRTRHFLSPGSDYSLLFDNFDHGVCILNELGNIEYTNWVYKEIFFNGNLDTEGKSIFKLKTDNTIINAFKDRRKVKATLINDCNSKVMKVYAWPIYSENHFKGVIAMYLINEMDSIRDESFYESRSQYSEELKGPFRQIVGESRKIKKALLVAQKASKTSSTVLIRGESGTGKELVSKAIHYYSNREKGPFVAVNCGAIPHNLLESELFGHEQGSFTGAIRRKIGKFELANEGTIFLDEIGDLPMGMQVKLLRVLQEKEFERVGGNEVIKTNIRIIAATNRNLEEMIKEGNFREDLYYRLNVIPICLPNLRDREEDIPLLINHFVKNISESMGKRYIQFSNEAVEMLRNYDWPGNIRELENVVERIIALSDKDNVGIYDLPSNISNIHEITSLRGEKTGLINMNSNGAMATLEEYEKEIIESAINKFGSFNAAGKALGITHKTVAFKARKYNIVD